MPTGSPGAVEILRRRLSGRRFESVTWVPTTGSTNDDLAKLAQDGAAEQVLVTDLQTAGKGRRDRRWDAPAGWSVLMSILIRDANGAPTAPFWVIGAVGLAARAAARSVAGVDVTIKWPNDLLVEDKKVAGVLTRREGEATVVGIGINVGWPSPMPEGLEGATSLNHHGDGEIDRVDFVGSLLESLEAELTGSDEEIRARWKSASATIGARVRLERDDGTVFGTAIDVAQDGALVVKTADGVASHHMGDVTHLRPHKDRS